MSCQEVSELMQRYLDKDLDEQEQKHLQEHLKSCSSCADLFERMKHLSDHLEQLPKVVPPVSLVDQIMPRLEEIDRLRQTAEQTDETAAAVPLNRRRSKQAYSYKILGGVVAAGILFGLFIFNNPQQTWENADELLAPNQAETMNAAGQASSAPAAGMEQSGSSSASAPEAKLFVADSAAADGAGVRQESVTAGSGAMGGSGAAPAVPNAKAGTAPLGSAPAPVQAPAQEDELSIAGGSFFLGETPEAGGGQDQTVTDEPAMITSIPPVGEGMMGIAGIVEQSDAAGGEERVTSPDGQYAAYVQRLEEGLQVVVVDAAQVVVYTSPVQAVDDIAGLVWTEDGKQLHYDAIRGEQAEHYTIDLDAGTARKGTE